MKRKSKFASRGESMLTGRIASLEEFLDDKPSSNEFQSKPVITEKRESDITDAPINVNPDKTSNPILERRFELKIPDHLAKHINDHAFERRISKAAVVIEALQKYFRV